MSGVDRRGCNVTGATPAALEAYERALAAHQSWHEGVKELVSVALQEAPTFVMAHVLRAWGLVCSRDPRQVNAARPLLALANDLPANDRERLHLAALAAVVGDDYESAKARLGEALRVQPRDILALQAAHALDYLTGDTARMKDRVKAVLPAWSNDLPGYHAVLAMHAFSLEECGAYPEAEQAARSALALNRDDARAHHVMAHVFEMTGRADEGARWMYEHLGGWGVDTIVATHCWWHLSLFHLAQGRPDLALTLYDRHIRAGRSGEVADLIDAASLLWRVEVAGGEAGKRWVELASAWSTHVDDGFCSFNDVHAMLAFVGARRWDLARRLELALFKAQSLATRYGETTRQVGLPACRALIAFGHGNDTVAMKLIRSFRRLVHRLGGSHAQRDVLHVALFGAIDHDRRPARWLAAAQSPSAARA